MKPIKITAKWIYPVSSAPIEEGEIIIEDGRITHIGNSTEDIEGFNKIDLKDHILLPGLINCHTHLDLSPLKEKISSGIPFINWLYEVIRLKNALLQDDYLEETEYAVDELLISGTTTIGDISSLDTAIDILLKKKVRAVSFFEITGFNRKKRRDALSSLFKRIKRKKLTGLISIGISPHSVYSVSDELFKSLYKFAEENKLPVMIHAAETEEENSFLREQESEFKSLLITLGKWDKNRIPPGCSAISYLERLGVCRNSILVHCNFPDKTGNDIDIIKRNHSSVVLCPSSNRWFKRSVKHPLPELLDKGVTAGLGTDSYASNNHLNMFYEMQEVKRQFPEIPFENIIKMATINGSYILSVEDITGSLSAGKEADIIAIRSDRLNNRNMLAEHIVNFKEDVSFSMIQGRIIIPPPSDI